MGRLLVSAVISMGSLFLANVVFASPGITYHGRLFDSTDTPVTDPSVKFKIQLRAPAPSKCLLFEEIHTRDMTLSQGNFAITLNDGTATTGDSMGIGLHRALQNRGVFNVGGANCENPHTSYTPGATDGRIVRVEFEVGASGYEPVPETTLNFVPMSLESVTLGGFAVGELFRVTDGSGAPVTMPAWTQTDYNTLLDIVTNGVDWADITGKPATFTAAAHTHPVSDITSDVGEYFTYEPNGAECTDGQVLKWTAANRWECANDTGGGGGDVHLSDLKSTVSGQLFDAPDCASNETLSWSAVTDQFTCIGISLNASAITAGNFAVARAPVGTANQVLGTNAAGTAAEFKSITAGTGIQINHSVGGIEIEATGGGAGDDLGDHTATTNLQLGSHWLSGDGGNEGIHVDAGGNVGVGTAAPNAKLTVDGPMVSVPREIASGATVDLSTSNTHVLVAVGGSTIDLQNPVHGAVYNIVIDDTTSRTYVFNGCTNSYFKPDNGPTEASARTIYGVMTVQRGVDWDCYITWSTGFK